jgi:hypothetical protein
MMNCQEVSRLLSETCDKECPFFQRILLRVHGFFCQHCAEFTRQLDLIVRMMKQLRNTQDRSALDDFCLSREAKDRIKQSLSDQKIPQ